MPPLFIARPALDVNQVQVSGGQVVVNHDLSEDVYVALRDAFDAARRQLGKHGRKQRGDKHHEPAWGQRQRIGESGADES